MDEVQKAKNNIKRLTISVKEASEITGIGINKLYELVHIEGFPVITIGKKKLIITEQLPVWLNKNIGRCL